MFACFFFFVFFFLFFVSFPVFLVRPNDTHVAIIYVFLKKKTKMQNKKIIFFTWTENAHFPKKNKKKKQPNTTKMVQNKKLKKQKT